LNNEESDNVIMKYHFPKKYNTTGDDYEFALIKVDEKVFLTDQGRTVEMLDKIFVLSEPDVIKNLIAILKELKVVQKTGSKLYIEINPWNGNPNEKENDILNDAIYRLFSCVSFMDMMRIFYV